MFPYPLLAIDRRAYEPMVAKEDEFWPKVPSMLVEMDPRANNFATDITSASKANTLMRDFLAMLMWRRALPVSESLDLVAPEAGTDLIEEASDGC